MQTSLSYGRQATTTSCMQEKYSSSVIMQAAILKPFKIRDTTCVRCQASHEWVNVELTEI